MQAQSLHDDLDKDIIMAVEQHVTDLPPVASAQLSDIVMAVQGFINPMSIGISVQETWQQVYNLFQSQTVLYNAGNPNGAVAGMTYQFCWDTTDSILYICTVTGNAASAVWTAVGTTNPVSFGWANANFSPVQMLTNHGYLQTFGALTTFKLPTVSAFGDKISVIGSGAGGWTITQAASQSVRIGTSASTIGVAGSVSSTNQYDAIELICINANFGWQVNSAPQGNITLV
jgi:hypothetical protein